MNELCTHTHTYREGEREIEEMPNTIRRRRHGRANVRLLDGEHLATKAQTDFVANDAVEGKCATSDLLLLPMYLCVCVRGVE